MKQISSTEFQKSYSRLDEPHEVTALGRVIGHYYPVAPGVPAPAVASETLQVKPRTGFFPAPKPGKK